MALHHAAAGEVLRLRSVADREVKTAALMRNASFETVHLVVRAGERILSHAVSGPIAIFCIDGMADIELDDGDRPMAAGDWIYLDPQARQAVRGIVDASLLLTILFTSPAARNQERQS